MEIIYSRRFKKQVKKLIENKKNLKNKVENCIIDFSENIRESRYYRKKMTGNWSRYEELQIGGDIRIIIKIYITKNSTIFEQICTHSSLDLC